MNAETARLTREIKDARAIIWCLVSMAGGQVSIRLDTMMQAMDRGGTLQKSISADLQYVTISAVEKEPT